MVFERKKYLLLLSSLGVVLACLSFLLLRDQTPKKYIVKMVDTGFEPDTIDIRKGDTITFLSVGNRTHWPAVNPHPLHTSYKTKEKGCVGSILDSCRGVKSGESFVFRFENVGTFGMHDHLFPGFVLIVNVRPRSNLLAISTFKQAEISNTSYLLKPEEFRKTDYSKKREIIKKLSMKDPKKAWEYLKLVAIEDGKVVDNVHEFAHMIGNAMYDKYGLEGMKSCSKEIIYGCYHGIAEKMLLKEGIHSIKKIESECINLYPPDENGVPRDPGCIHGIGHGILSWHNLDLKKALNDCDLLGGLYKGFCYNGVFMELAVSSTNPFPKNSSKLKLCEKLTDDQQKICASYIPTLLLKWNSLNVQDIVIVCKQGHNELIRDRCLWAIGYRLAVGYTGNLESILSECKHIKETKWHDNCLIGAAQEVSFQHYSNWEHVGEGLCASVLISDTRNRCIQLKDRLVIQ